MIVWGTQVERSPHSKYAVYKISFYNVDMDDPLTPVIIEHYLRYMFWDSPSVSIMDDLATVQEVEVELHHADRKLSLIIERGGSHTLEGDTVDFADKWLERIASSPPAAKHAIDTWSMENLARILPYVFVYCPNPLWVDAWRRIDELDETGEQANTIYKSFRNFITSKGGGGNVVRIKVKWFHDSPREVANILKRFRTEVELPYYRKLKEVKSGRYQ